MVIRPRAGAPEPPRREPRKCRVLVGKITFTKPYLWRRELQSCPGGTPCWRPAGLSVLAGRHPGGKTLSGPSFFREPLPKVRSRRGGRDVLLSGSSTSARIHVYSRRAVNAVKSPPGNAPVSRAGCMTSAGSGQANSKMDRAGIVMGFLLVKTSLLVRETSVLPEVGHEIGASLPAKPLPGPGPV